MAKANYSSLGQTTDVRDFLSRVLEKRGVKQACHSDAVPDAEAAQEVQKHLLEEGGVTVPETTEES